MAENRLSRRCFLQHAAALTGAALIPSVLSPETAASETITTSDTPRAKKTTNRKVLGANNKVDIAMIGIGNRGAEVLNLFAETGLCNVVALCDVDMGAKHTRNSIARFPNVPRFRDFRELFDKMVDRLDAVVVATPDHSHFPICMAAMRAGLHVYVEKPMARTFYECELLMQAEQKYGVVTQMGNQGHSEANYFQFKAWQQAGIIRDVTSVTAHMNSPRRWHTWDPKMTAYPKAQPVPPDMDWETWLSAAQEHAYNDDYHNGQWRCWYDFGMGALGDWGAHLLDTVHEFLDLGLPSEVDPLYLKDHNRFFYPMSSTLKFRFPARGAMPALDINWYDGLDNLPPLPKGYGVSELDANIPTVAGRQMQTAKLNPGKEIYSEQLTFKGGSHGSTLSIIPDEKAREWAPKLPEVPESPSNHYANFLLSCLGREKARSPFSVAGPLSQLFCLGVIAQWTGERIYFDRASRQITNNPLANQLLWGAVPRSGWEDFYKL